MGSAIRSQRTRSAALFWATSLLSLPVAMAFYACQLTFEEKFVKKYNIKPINAICLEGSFAVAILSVMLVVLDFIPVKFDMEQPGDQVVLATSIM